MDPGVDDDKGEVEEDHVVGVDKDDDDVDVDDALVELEKAHVHPEVARVDLRPVGPESRFRPSCGTGQSECRRVSEDDFWDRVPPGESCLRSSERSREVGGRGERRVEPEVTWYEGGRAQKRIR